jgi:hypothetical protein
MAIKKITCEHETVVELDVGRGIHKDRLMQIVQTHRIDADSNDKYKLMQLMYFCVPLEMSDLQGFLKNGQLEYPNFMKTPTYLAHLVVENSLSVFHDLHSLFVFFREDASAKKKSVAHSKTQKYKSILKSGGDDIGSVGSANRTKKVRFQTNSE